MEFYAKYIVFYHRAYVRSVRLLVLFLTIVTTLFLFINDQNPKIPIFALNIFLISEIFFSYKVNRVQPKLTVDKNDGKKLFESFTLPALLLFKERKNTPEIIRQLFKNHQVRCFMQKANMTEKDVILRDTPMDVLAGSALEVAKTFHGKFVTTIDIFIAYIMLTEGENKLLFAKQLKTEDLSNLLLWIKQNFTDEESPQKIRFKFSGGGVGDFLVTGWTPETKKYTRNFMYTALKNKAMITGREKEFKMLLEGLIRAENNNVLLVGDIGSGKENLVRAFAWHSFEGNLGRLFDDRTVLELMPGSFMAGASNRNDIETRLQNIISEISHAGNVVLYIPEFQNLMGASSYNLDISGALLPYLQSGDLPVIAAMTTGSYKTYMDRNSLKQVFTVIVLNEPDKNTAKVMVMDKTHEIEEKNKVILSYRSIASAVELAERFYQDQILPGSAVSLLQSVANKVALSNVPKFEHSRRKIVLEEQVVKHIEETLHVAISMPGQKEIDTLLHLEEKLHERVISQNEAIVSLSEAMRRIRSGMSTSQRPVSFLFLGPTGVGKTETAKTLSELYFGGEKKMIRLDMSEYTDEIGLRRLLGSPPGQGDERGELTDKIKDAPASLVLLDEFEKAHPKIHDLFLQVLDDGRLTDNKGITVSFRNAMIIATSNAGSEFIREEIEKGAQIDKVFHKRLLDQLMANKLFKPELLNRFDDVIIFKPLGQAEVKQVVGLMLKKITMDLDKQDIKISFDDAVIEKIVQEGYDQEFGARPLRRYIQDNIEDQIAKRKLTGEIARGKTVNIGVDGAGNIQVSVG